VNENILRTILGLLSVSMVALATWVNGTTSKLAVLSDNVHTLRSSHVNGPALMEQLKGLHSSMNELRIPEGRSRIAILEKESAQFQHLIVKLDDSLRKLVIEITVLQNIKKGG